MKAARLAKLRVRNPLPEIFDKLKESEDHGALIELDANRVA